MIRLFLVKTRFEVDIRDTGEGLGELGDITADWRV